MRNEFWIISTLISIGVIGGFIYNWPKNSNGGADRQFPDSSVVIAPKQADLEPKQIVELKSQAAETWRKGDNFLIVGNFDGALEQYETLLRYNDRLAIDNKKDLRLLFRLGLASELNEEYKSAEYFYRLASAPDNPNLSTKLAVQLARTRNWVKLGRSTDAVETLSRLYLNFESDKNLKASIRFSFGQQLFDIASTNARQLLFKTSSKLQSPPIEVCPIEIENSLALIDGELHSVEPAVDPEESVSNDNEQPQIEILQNPNGEAELTILRANTPSKAVAKLLAELADQTDLQFQIGSKVQPYIIGRTVRVKSEAISIALLLDIVLKPLNLVWRQDGNRISIVPDTVLSNGDLESIKAEQAIRIGRQLVFNYPEHRCRDAIRLAIANLELLSGDYDAAATMLSQLLDEGIVGELRAQAHLNLGLIGKTLERYDDAVKQLLSAVDQSLNNDLQAIAYANMARVQIEQNFIGAAIISGGRSVSLTENPLITSAAALDLARAYLVNNDPQSANRVLFEHDKAILDGVDRKLATCFGAYARSLATLSPIAKKHAMETLVIALSEIVTRELRFTVDRIIVADAFSSIGLTDRATEALVITNAFAENQFWNRKRTFELARILNKTGKNEPAIANFEKLSLDIRDLIGQRSLLTLAEYHLNDKSDPNECIRLLRRLWDEEQEEVTGKVDEVVMSTALRIMGNAYRELGDLESAVYCFSGALPNQPTAR